ncbi:MAG: tryptophan--tRNA ligase [Candidatus Parcubacteria bacterium]|nr:tryptophan--tRNA ligase [Candidatus Parcubacteria bacterium]
MPEAFATSYKVQKVNFMNQPVFSNKNIRILTGDRPTGKFHLGHLFGSLQERINLQNEGAECFFIIADYQAITDRLTTKDLEENILEATRTYLALGIDPTKSHIFVQSQIPEDSELFSLFSMMVNMGRLGRNPTTKAEFRAAVSKGFTGENQMSLGLFSYPVFQAADILLFNATTVPVGEDQLPHIEQTKEIAEFFNKHFGKVFNIPKPLITKGARILGLDGVQKMSKSLNNAIYIFDPPEVITAKIKKAQTDSNTDIKYDPQNRPGLSNLINIYSLSTGMRFPEIEKTFVGKNYSQFKESLANVLIKYLTPYRERYIELLKDDKAVKEALRMGTEAAQKEARKTMAAVKKALLMQYPNIF